MVRFEKLFPALIPALIAAGMLSFACSSSFAEEMKDDHAGHDHSHEGHDHSATEGAAKSAEAATAAEPDDGFENQVDRVSYAIGLNIAQSFKEASIEVNTEVLAEAIATGYSGGEAKLTGAQIEAVLQAFQQEQQAKQMQQLMADQQVAGKANTEAGTAFLTANAAKEGVKTTESGLQYMITEQGDGPNPGPNDTVTLHYTGKLLDGTEFDSSVGGEPVSFPIDKVIAGFGEGLQLFPVGSKGKLFIPGDLAYGPSPQGPGGPNSTLIFDVEILGTQAPAKTEREPLGD